MSAELQTMQNSRHLSANALSAFGYRSSGFPDLDRAIGGLWSGDLVLIAACDEGGKTALALNIAEHLAMKQMLPVAYFSTHMGVDQLASRIVASIGRIALENLHARMLTEHEAPRLLSATQELNGSDLHVEAIIGWEFMNLRNRALTLAQRYGRLGLLVIDSLDYLKLSLGRVPQFTSQLDIKLQRCALLAIELGCPVLALLRSPETSQFRQDARPVFSDLALSEQERKSAQTILTIYLKDQFAARGCKEPGIALVKVFQNRLGNTASLKLAFLERIAIFESLAFSE